MAYDSETPELQSRIKHLEDQLKAFRFTFVIVCLVLGLQLWTQLRPRGIQTAGIVRAHQFDVVDDAGKTVAVLSRENGLTHLVLYGADYKAAAEFSVFGADPGIAFYDREQKQRAILGMRAGSPTLAIHDAGGEVRALLTEGNNGSVFWLKDKDGSATILGNAVNESRKLEKVDGKVVLHDTVQTTSGASIRIQDAKSAVLWKAP